MEFKKYDINQLNSDGCDCVVNAIGIALNLTWEEVYFKLCEIGKKLYRMPNDKKTLIEFLKDYEYVSLKAIKGEPRKKVKDFMKGTYILRIANHITVVSNGKLIDKWDCRDKVVYNYWVISNERL